MMLFHGKFDKVHHTDCGGNICLCTDENVIVCEKCDWSYSCQELERPIHAVYRLIDQGIFIDDENVEY